MCDPLTIAGVALSAGSMVANSVAQSKVQSARNDALAAERIRQGTLDKEAAAVNNQSRDRYTGFGDKQEDTRQGLSEYIKSQTTPEPEAGTMMPATTSDLVVREETNQRQKARDFTDNTGDALASLRSFGDLLGGIGRDQSRDAGQIGQIGGFKQGWANVLPYELEAANEKGSGLRLLGDVLGGVGSVGMSAGLSGGGFGGLGGLGGAAKTATKIPVPTARPYGTGGVSLTSLYGAR